MADETEQQIQSNARSIAALSGEVVELKGILERTLKGVGDLSAIKDASLVELKQLAQQLAEVQAECRDTNRLAQSIDQRMSELEKSR